MGLKDIWEHAPAWLNLIWLAAAGIFGYVVREYTRTRDHEKRIKALEECLAKINERELKEADRRETVRMVVSELGRFTEAVERRSQ